MRQLQSLGFLMLGVGLVVSSCVTPPVPGPIVTPPGMGQPVAQECSSPNRPSFSKWPMVASRDSTPVEYQSIHRPESDEVALDLGNRRIRSQSALDLFLKKSGIQINLVQAVDFEKEEVLAFYSKGGSSSCEDAKLRYLVRSENSISFYFASLEDMNPDHGRMCAAEYVQPHYVMIRMPRADEVAAIQGGVRGVTEFAAVSTQEIGIQVLDQGDHSKVISPQTFIVRTADQYQAMAREHDPESIDRGLPQVDFDRQMLVAVFLGEKPNPGYGVIVEDAYERDGQITVVYRETRPDPEKFYAEVIIQPYVWIVMPKAEARVQLQEICVIH